VRLCLADPLAFPPFHNNQGFDVIFDSGGQTVNASSYLIAMFMSLFVVYGLDTAGTLAEETKNPRAEAPKAVLASIVGAFVIGAIFLYGTLIAVPDLKGAAESVATTPATVIDAAFGPAVRSRSSTCSSSRQPYSSAAWRS
jgi:amino acid transporter